MNSAMHDTGRARTTRSPRGPHAHRRSRRDPSPASCRPRHCARHTAPPAPRPPRSPACKYDNPVQVGGSRLAAQRRRRALQAAIVKVYTAGLYLGAKAATPEAVIAAPGPKRMHVVMLRDIDANELGKLFTRGMQDNAPREEFSKSIPGTMRMADIFSAQEEAGGGRDLLVD